MWHPHCQTHVVLGLSDEPSTRDVSHLGPGVTWFVCAPWGVPGETHSRPAPLSVAPHHYLYSAPSWVTGWTVLSSCCSQVFGDLPKSQPGSACILAPSQGGCSRPPVLMKRGVFRAQTGVQGRFPSITLSRSSGLVFPAAVLPFSCQRDSVGYGSLGRGWGSKQE